jgi:hypothetical protein
VALHETGFPIDSSTPPEAKPDGEAESSPPVNCRCARKPEYGLGGAVVLTFTRMFPPTSDVEVIEIVPPVPAVGVAAWAGRTLIAAALATNRSAKSVRTTGFPFTVCSPLYVRYRPRQGDTHHCWADRATPSSVCDGGRATVWLSSAAEREDTACTVWAPLR